MIPTDPSSLAWAGLVLTASLWLFIVRTGKFRARGERRDGVGADADSVA